MSNAIQQVRGALLATLFAAVFAVSAHGAVVSFGSVTDIASNSSGGEILTNGDYRFAWNAGTTSGSDVTVNGVTFYSDPLEVLPSGVTLAHTADLLLDSGRSSGESYTGNFFTLMDGNALSSQVVGGDTFDVTLNGLTPGTHYRVQFLMYDVGPGRSMRVESGASQTAFFTPDQNDIGKSLVATFESDSTSQTFTFRAQGDTDRSVLNGLALFQVIPEPSVALLALVAIGLLRARRTLRR